MLKFFRCSWRSEQKFRKASVVKKQLCQLLCNFGFSRVSRVDWWGQDTSGWLYYDLRSEGPDFDAQFRTVILLFLEEIVSLNGIMLFNYSTFVATQIQKGKYRPVRPYENEVCVNSFTNTWPRPGAPENWERTKFKNFFD